MAQHTASKKHPRRGHTVLAVLLVLLALAALALGMAFLAARREINGSGKTGQSVTVSIEQGSGAAAIAQSLKEAQLIRWPRLFRWYVGKNNAAAKLQYGEFELQKGSSYDELIETLSVYAKAKTVRLTFPEGSTALSIAQKLEEAGLCAADEFIAEADGGDFSEYRFWQYVPDDEDAPGRFLKCEGYLFPETYEFFVDDTVHNYVATFYSHFDERITDDVYQELEKQDMTLHQLITLASIVQEEAGNAQNSNVAQVFRNRLAAGSPHPRLESNTSSHIQSDEDNNYLWNWVAPYYGGWDKIPQEITEAYDTYSREGLPAGPVSNPGIEAIMASLSPEPDEDVEDCYFFVTDESGKYYYGKTLKEHNANCKKAAEANKELKTE